MNEQVIVANQIKVNTESSRRKENKSNSALLITAITRECIAITIIRPAMSSNSFVAKYSSQGHSLCFSLWQISYKGQPITLPADKAENDICTYDNFSWPIPMMISISKIPQWMNGSLPMLNGFIKR